MADLKQDFETIEQVTTSTTARFRNAPQWIRDMPSEELEQKERRIRRKIDARLYAFYSIPAALGFVVDVPRCPTPGD